MKHLKEELELLEFLEANNTYPPRSTIIFLQSHEDKNRFNCASYDKVGKKGRDGLLENIISKPKEWQGLTLQQAHKVCEPFDQARIIKFITV